MQRARPGTTSPALMKRTLLSNLYIRETKDGFLSAQHSATGNFPRLTFRALFSSSREGHSCWRKSSTVGVNQSVTVRMEGQVPKRVPSEGWTILQCR
jgi:hypothetical protein